jgi:hypothetical protein
MSLSDRLRHLIEASAIYWAGEAEIVRTYFHAPDRSRETDRAWIAKQCFKEVWGSGLTARNESMMVAWATELCQKFDRIDTEFDRHDILELAEAVHEEFAHYCSFADAHDAMAAPGEPKITPAAVRALNWKGDDDLSELRRDVRAEHGAVGWRSCRFTEGGYCTLFAEGMALAGNPDGADGRNGLIAEACASVYEDEFGHMLSGIVGIDAEAMTDAEWELFEQLSLDQLRLRLVMRNEQFGFPVAEARLRAIENGDIEPIAFDYERAKLAA